MSDQPINTHAADFVALAKMRTRLKEVGALLDDINEAREEGDDVRPGNSDMAHQVDTMAKTLQEAANVSYGMANLEGANLRIVSNNDRLEILSRMGQVLAEATGYLSEVLADQIP